MTTAQHSCSRYFNHESNPGSSLVDKVNATYTFEIYPHKVGSGESKKWTIDLKTKPGKCIAAQEVRSLDYFVEFILFLNRMVATAHFNSRTKTSYN